MASADNQSSFGQVSIHSQDSDYFSCFETGATDVKSDSPLEIMVDSGYGTASDDSSTSKSASSTAKDDETLVTGCLSIPASPPASRAGREGRSRTRPRSVLQKPPPEPQSPEQKRQQHCALCWRPFGRTVSAVRAHLDNHAAKSVVQYACDVCKIAFPSQTELEKHQTCAQDQHCGLDFEHTTPCLGHHPPSSNVDVFSDHDRMRLYAALHAWGHTQLHSYIRDVDHAFSRVAPAPGNRRNLGAMCRNSVASMSMRLRRSSMTSTSQNIDSVAEATSPPPPTAFVSRRTSMLSQRTQQASKAYRRMTGATRDDAQLDRSLNEAAIIGNVREAERLLLNGATVNACRSSYAATPATLALVHGHSEMVAFLLKHDGNFNYPVFVERECIDSQTDEPELSLRLAYPVNHMFSSKDRPYVARRGWAGVGQGGWRYESALGRLDALQCTLAIGRGERDDDYIMIPPCIVDDFYVQDLPMGIALCYAIEHGHTEVAELLCQRVSPGRTAIAVRLAADQGRYRLLARLLNASVASAEAVKVDASILRSAAFGMRRESVDVLLSHTTNSTTASVLQTAIDKNRLDVVRLLCVKTFALADPLDRRFDSCLSPKSLNLDATTVRLMVQSCKRQGRAIDPARAYVFLASGDATQRPEIVGVLRRAGADDNVVLQALRAVEHAEQRQLRWLVKINGAREKRKTFANGTKDTQPHLIMA